MSTKAEVKQLLVVLNNRLKLAKIPMPHGNIIRGFANEGHRLETEDGSVQIGPRLPIGKLKIFVEGMIETLDLIR